MIVQGLNLGLYPDREGELRVARVTVPDVDTWSGIRGITTYRNKDLVIHQLVLDENARFETVNVNASQIGQGKLTVGLDGNLGGGPITSHIDLSTAGSSTTATAKLQANSISLGKLGKYFGQAPGQLAGEVRNVRVDLHGKLEELASWNGTVDARAENLRGAGVLIDRIILQAGAKDGQAVIREGRIERGNNHLLVHGSVDLPRSQGGFGRAPGNLQFSLNAADLQQLAPFLTPPPSGSLQANGNIKTENDRTEVEANATGQQIHFGEARIANLAAQIAARKQLLVPNEKKNVPVFEGLSSNVRAQLNDLRYADFAVDQVQATAKSEGAKVTLTSLLLQDGANTLEANGTVRLPPPAEKLMDQPADLQFHLRASQLSDFWETEAANKIAGQLQGNGNLRLRGGVASGDVNVSGQEITAQRLVVRQVNLQATIDRNVVHLKDLSATMNDQDYLRAQGRAGLEKPFQYSGTATAHLADLSAFQSLLPESETKPSLAGSLVLDWKGEGNLNALSKQGELHLRLENGRYADLQKLEASVEAHYTPEQLSVPVIYLGSDKLTLQASVQTQNKRLEVSNVQVTQGATKYAVGYLAIPFALSDLGSDRPLFPPNGQVQINFQSENLDLARLFRDLGREPPVSGQLSVKLDAQGPLDQLQASLNLQMQNLEAATAKQLEPAKIDLALQLQNNQLNLLGKISQAKIQPVQIDARLPFNVSKIIAEKKVDEQTPVQAKVVMPPSSINFVREFVPALRQLDGNLALNVNVGGTIARPALSGAANIRIVTARFENPTLPALSNFGAQLNFRNDTLNFDRFAGDLAGGPFNVSGRVTLAKLTEPTFDLRLRANSILVARNDNLTARVDADIKVEGPLKAATVSGQVLTTNSRFFKNIDIIPIALPGRPAPHPEPPSAAPQLSFPTPPLRDWKFDLSIKSKDPFLIRGNLATGKAIIDMKVAGTGLHPQLQGQVRLETFDATLPFSTLSINLGFLYFDPDDPFNPRIEMQGTSLIRDYTIHVYVYGTANAPQAIFSSEPPLPQEEIISLLATGTTREELATGNVLASRAGILLVKQLYRKIFKKGAEPETNDNSFFNRLDVEFGNTDPRTGEQTATARYKINDRFVLIGDIGTQGDFRGLLKYLIRFR
jgi:autotransporter translocation and assembly factor TamB